MFRAIQLTRENDQFKAALAELSEAALPAFTAHHSVRLRVEYSCLNYKDGLALTNRAPVVRQWPMVPGIDGAGVIEYSDDPAIQPGTRHILNGFGVGESHWGCLSQRAQLNSQWLVPLPDTLSSREAMAIGTAGYTAMLSVMALEQSGVTKDSGEILVTGASGGVGSMAIALLSHLGFTVVAATGKSDEHEFLRSLGARDIIDRSALNAAGKPLQKERWAGVIDSVGSHTLANACAQVRYGGAVTACGLAQGMDFPASVAPFILRAVRLIGIDSVQASLALRRKAWARLATDLPRALLQSIVREIALDEVIDGAHALMEGKVRGRLLVNVNALHSDA